jgi:ATP-dependent DNA helicase RecG
MQVKTLSLSDDLTCLRGIGSKKAAILKKHGVNNIGELLYYFPRRYLDRTNIKPIGSLRAGEKVTVIGQILASGELPGRKKRFEAILGDDSGHVTLLWFGGLRFVKQQIKKGVILSVSGEVKEYRGLQLIHPEYERLGDKNDADSLLHTAGIVPVYSSTADLTKYGMTSRGFRNIIKEASSYYSLGGETTK